MIGPVAQLVEQRPFKPLVEGSNPSWLTKINPVKHIFTGFVILTIFDVVLYVPQ